MKRYIVCVPVKNESFGSFGTTINASPFSVEAESHLEAARKVFARIETLKDRTIGEITVVEAKAGRLDTYFNHYSLDKVLGV